MSDFLGELLPPRTAYSSKLLSGHHRKWARWQQKDPVMISYQEVSGDHAHICECPDLTAVF